MRLTINNLWGAMHTFTRPFPDIINEDIYMTGRSIIFGIDEYLLYSQKQLYAMQGIFVIYMLLIIVILLGFLLFAAPEPDYEIIRVEKIIGTEADSLENHQEQRIALQKISKGRIDKKSQKKLL